MTNLATVNFNGTNGALLQTFDPAWTLVTGTTGNSQIANNRLRPSSANTTSAYYHSASPSSPDYSVSADIVLLSSTANNLFGVIGRCFTSANTFYHARFNDGNGWQLFKFINGTGTQLGSTSSASLNIGQSYRLALTMAGSSINVYVDGVLLISATDSSITTTGKGGVRSFESTIGDTSGIHLDNFSIDESGPVAGSANGSSSSRAIAGSLGLSSGSSIASAYSLSTSAGASIGSSIASAISGSIGSSIGTSSVTAQSGFIGLSQGSSFVQANYLPLFLAQSFGESFIDGISGSIGISFGESSANAIPKPNGSRPIEYGYEILAIDYIYGASLINSGYNVLNIESDYYGDPA